MNGHTLRLMERVASAVAEAEPLLLVGETGTGKTTSLQYFANQIGKKIVPFNLSQQSESGDLLGGFKPVDMRSLMLPLKEDGLLKGLGFEIGDLRGERAHMASALLQDGLLEDLLALARLYEPVDLLRARLLPRDCVCPPLHYLPAQL